MVCGHFQPQGWLALGVPWVPKVTYSASKERRVNGEGTKASTVEPMTSA